MVDVIDDLESIYISIGAAAHGIIDYFTATPSGTVAPNTIISLDYQFSNNGDFSGTIWSQVWNVTDNTLLSQYETLLNPGQNSGNRNVTHTILHDTLYRVIVGHGGTTDDTQDIPITVLGEGFGDITNLVYDPLVLPETSIDIQFDLTNTSSYPDTLWWGLYTKPFGSEEYTQLVPGTYGFEVFNAQQTKTKIITISAGITEPLDAMLNAGHVG